MESSVHRLSEPDMFSVFTLAGPPVLAWDLSRSRIHTGLPGLHVAEDLDCIYSAALIGINPVFT